VLADKVIVDPQKPVAYESTQPIEFFQIVVCMRRMLRFGTEIIGFNLNRHLRGHLTVV
jgi:hypothetical protein